MKILFLCVANAARSQIAEGLAKKMFPEFDVRSAGSKPSKLDSFATAVMSEVGVDISKQYSKSLSSLPKDYIESLDYIITLCAEEYCPTTLAPKARRLHWHIPDPVSKTPISGIDILPRFRKARDLIEAKLVAFKKEV